MNFEIFQSKKNKQWYFRLRSNNGKIIAQSEGYTQKKSAKHTVNVIKERVANAEIVMRND